MAVALAAIGANVHVLGANGERTIPIPGLHRLPGDKPQHDTVLNAGDLITAVELGAPAPRSTYRKVRDRASFAFAVFSVAAAVEVEDGAVKEARIALGGVAHVPWRAERAEAVLRGADGDRRGVRCGGRCGARGRRAPPGQRLQSAVGPQRARPDRSRS